MADVPEALNAFEQGLHQASLVSFGVTLIAALARVAAVAQSREARPPPKGLGKLVTDGSRVGSASGSVASVDRSRRCRADGQL
jgi:hypothetical protein